MTTALIHNEIPGSSWEGPSEYHSDAFTTKPLESLAVEWKTSCAWCHDWSFKVCSESENQLESD